MKKIFSLILSFAMALAIIVPTVSAEADAAFSVRTSLPSYSSDAGKAYYYSGSNIFYNSGYGPNKVKRSDGKYCVGNCTWYAYGRASEILGKPLDSNFRWDAARWWDINKRGNYYPYGSTPKAGAIVCYDNHVAIVEKVVGSTVYISESMWTLSKNKPSSASQIVFSYGVQKNRYPKGYIYITDTVSSSNVKNVNYSVKITSSTLNMRTGPGTSYSRIGYVKPGTYKVSQECGSWVKLSDSGYWVCSDYVTKTASSTAETVADTGTAANYKVKITISNLNMRLGPGTGYKSKGYIKTGTYTVTKTSNGWGFIKEAGYWVCLTYTTKVTSTASASSNTSSTSGSTVSSSSSVYKVKINTLALRMRSGPGTSYSMKGLVLKGATYEIKATKNGWGQLKKNGYWIKLSYTVPVSGEYNIKVTYSDLNMRTGPGITYTRKGYIKPGIHTITETKNGWGKVKSNGYWIKLSYTKTM